MTGTHEVTDERAARRRSRVLVGAYVGLVLGAGAIGGVIGATRRHDHHAHPLPGLLMLGGVLIVVATLGGALLWFMIRRPFVQRLMAYGWWRRFRVGKQLRRGQPISTQDWPLAEAIHDAVRRQWWAPIFWAALLLFETFNAVAHHGSARWLYGAVTVMLFVAVPWAIWERRRIRRGYARERARHEGLLPPSP